MLQPFKYNCCMLQPFKYNCCMLQPFKYNCCILQPFKYNCCMLQPFKYNWKSRICIINFKMSETHLARINKMITTGVPSMERGSAPWWHYKPMRTFPSLTDFSQRSPFFYLPFQFLILHLLQSVVTQFHYPLVGGSLSRLLWGILLNTWLILLLLSVLLTYPIKFWHFADRVFQYIYLSTYPTWCTKFVSQFHNKFYFTIALHSLWYQRLCNAILTSWWWARVLETCRGMK